MFYNDVGSTTFQYTINLTRNTPNDKSTQIWHNYTTDYSLLDNLLDNNNPKDKSRQIWHDYTTDYFLTRQSI